MSHYRETYQGGFGVTSTLHLEGEDMVHQHSQDVRPLLDENSRLRQHTQVGSPGKGWKLAARVPLVIAHKWRQEFFELTGHRHNEKGYTKLFRDFYLSKLDDPDFRDFRIDGGNLGGKTIAKPQVVVGESIRSALSARGAA